MPPKSKTPPKAKKAAPSTRPRYPRKAKTDGIAKASAPVLKYAPVPSAKKKAVPKKPTAKKTATPKQVSFKKVPGPQKAAVPKKPLAAKKPATKKAAPKKTTTKTTAKVIAKKPVTTTGRAIAQSVANKPFDHHIAESHATVDLLGAKVVTFKKTAPPPSTETFGSPSRLESGRSPNKH